MERPKESDWKKYKHILEKVRERYLQEKNQVFIKMLTQSPKTPTDQFWNTLEAMKEEAKILDQCLGNISRSNMLIQMVSMLKYGMLQEKDLADFSDTLKNNLKPFLKN